MIGRTISHYKILQPLGEGGMGAVYLAQDTQLGRHVAIKFPLDEHRVEHHFRARFLREARAASALNHPNIATIYDYGETLTGQPYIVMEYVEGRGLNELIVGCALHEAITLQLAAADANPLPATLTQSIVHRDTPLAFTHEQASAQPNDVGSDLFTLVEVLYQKESGVQARTLLCVKVAGSVL